MEPTKPDSGATPIETAGGASIPKVEVLRPDDTFIKAVESTPDAHAGIEMVKDADIAQEKIDLGVAAAGAPNPEEVARQNEEKADLGLNNVIPPVDSDRVAEEMVDPGLSTSTPDSLDTRRQAAQTRREREELGDSSDLSPADKARIDDEKAGLEPAQPVVPTEPAGGTPLEPPKTGPSATTEVRDELQLAQNRIRALENATPADIIRDNPGITTVAGAEEFRAASLAEARKIVDIRNGGPVTPEPGAPAPKTPEESAARLKELQDEKDAYTAKLESGQPLTPEEYERSKIVDRELKEGNKNPNAAFEAAVERFKKGESIEGDDDILTGVEIPDVETKSLEQIEAENQEKLDQLGLKATELFAADKNPADAIIALKKEMAAQQGITLSKEDEAITREFYKGIYDADGNAPYRETARARAIKEKFKELGQMEMMIINYAEIVQKQRDEEDKMKEQTNRAEDDYLREQEPAQRIKKLNEWNLKARALERLQASTRGIKQRGRDMVEKQREVAGWIHRKLGTKKWYQNVGYGFHSTLIGAKHNLQRPGDIVDIFA